jgi:RsiW-degrading membrane proteinase PrsW (M82 family)
MRRRSGPTALGAITCALGAVAGVAVTVATTFAASWTGLDVRSSVAGEGPALLFLLAFVVPVGEVSKVVATWPAFLSDSFRKRQDGVVFAALAALGFAAAETTMFLRAHPDRNVWIARALVALPAHVFFASLWGYALGRAKESQRRATSIFPLAWLVATASHGLYSHIVFGRGAGALVGVTPLLLAMAGVAWVAGRDLRLRDEPAPRITAVPASGMERFSRVLARAEPPSLHAVRDALRRGNQPVQLRWILFGAFVTVGAMVVGLSASIAFGHWMHIDFSVVDEHDASTTAPLALLGAGLLMGFPISGFLIARASNVSTLLEPALASALAILAVSATLGLLAPIALLFAFAFSPIAFGLSCAGAWVGLSPG